MKTETKLALLITPMMLTSAATMAQPVVNAYDHATQSSVTLDVNGFQPLGSTSTFNGTQTFSWDGQPSDADSDTDQQ